MNSAGKSFVGVVCGGFFVVLPVLLAGIIFEHAFVALQQVIHPLMDLLPGAFFCVAAIRFLVVCAAIVGLLWLLGVVAGTGMGKRAGRWLESTILIRLPLYKFFRSFSSGLAGKDDGESLRPVLVTMNPGIQQLGFVIERHNDGNATVFLPSSPNPGSGTVMVVEAALLGDLRVPAHRVFQCMSGWGHGAKALLTTPR